MLPLTFSSDTICAFQLVQCELGSKFHPENKKEREREVLESLFRQVIKIQNTKALENSMSSNILS